MRVKERGRQKSKRKTRKPTKKEILARRREAQRKTAKRRATAISKKRAKALKLERLRANRRRQRDRARVLARRQSQGYSSYDKEAIEKAFLDPRVAGITATTPRLDTVIDKREMEELAKNQSWVRGAWERNEVIIKVSISTRKTRKKFAIRG